MRLKHCVGIACYNLGARKRYTLRLFGNILLLFSVLMVWLVLSDGMENAHNAYLYGAANRNTQFLTLTLDDAGNIVDDDAYQTVIAAAEQPEFDAPVFIGTPNLPQILGERNWRFVNIRYATLSLDGQTYAGSNERAVGQTTDPDVPKTAAAFSFSVVYSDRIVTDNAITEFNYYHKDAPYLHSGSITLGAHDLILSDYMLTLFGVTQPPEELIGKTVSFSVNERLLLEDYRIAGVIDSRLCGDGAQIFVRGDTEPQQWAALQTIEVQLPIHSASNAPDALNWLERRDVVLTMFAWKNAQYYYNIESVHLIIQRLVSLFGFLILLAIVLNLSNVLLHAADSRRRQCGILKAIGMTPGALLFISFFELFAVSFVAMLASLGISVLLLRGMDQLLLAFIHMHLTVSAAQYAKAGAMALLSLFSVLMLLSYFILRRSCKAQPSALLHGGSK